LRIWFLGKWAVHLVSISGNMCGFIAFDRELCAISYVIVSVSNNDSQGRWSWTCYCSRHGIRATLQAVTHHQETYAGNGCTCHDVNKLCTIRRTSKAFYQFVKMKHLTCDRTLIGDRYRILSCCPSKETKRKKNCHPGSHRDTRTCCRDLLLMVPSVEYMTWLEPARQTRCRGTQDPGLSFFSKMHMLRAQKDLLWTVWNGWLDDFSAPDAFAALQEQRETKNG
jgi:hypothetical protein